MIAWFVRIILLELRENRRGVAGLFAELDRRWVTSHPGPSNFRQRHHDDVHDDLSEHVP